MNAYLTPLAKMCNRKSSVDTVNFGVCLSNTTDKENNEKMLIYLNTSKKIKTITKGHVGFELKTGAYVIYYIKTGYVFFDFSVPKIMSKDKTNILDINEALMARAIITVLKDFENTTGVVLQNDLNRIEMTRIDITTHYYMQSVDYQRFIFYKTLSNPKYASLTKKFEKGNKTKLYIREKEKTGAASWSRSMDDVIYNKTEEMRLPGYKLNKNGLDVIRSECRLKKNLIRRINRKNNSTDFLSVEYFIDNYDKCLNMFHAKAVYNNIRMNMLKAIKQPVDKEKCKAELKKSQKSKSKSMKELNEENTVIMKNKMTNQWILYYVKYTDKNFYFLIAPFIYCISYTAALWLLKLCRTIKRNKNFKTSYNMYSLLNLQTVYTYSNNNFFFTPLII